MFGSIVGTRTICQSPKLSLLIQEQEVRLVQQRGHDPLLRPAQEEEEKEKHLQRHRVSRDEGFIQIQVRAKQTCNGFPMSIFCFPIKLIRLLQFV